VKVNGQFSPWLLYPCGKSSQYPLDRRLGGPQSLSGHGTDEQNSFLALEDNRFISWYY